MKAHLSERQISDWIAGNRSGEVGQHLSVCPQCAAETGRTERALLLFRDSGIQCAEYWQQRPKPRTSRLVPRLAVATIPVLVVMATILVRHSSAPRLVPPAQEVFLQIPYVVPPAPYERTKVVRMDVPVAALIAAGFRMQAPAADSVSADVVVGQDGRPLAVGFPENKQ